MPQTPTPPSGHVLTRNNNLDPPFAWAALPTGQGWKSRTDVSSQCDGQTVAFVVPAYNAGTIEVLVNGLWQGIEGTHFTESDDAEITLDRPPHTGEEVIVAYIPEGGTIVDSTRENLSAQIPAEGGVYTASSSFVAGSLVVYVNGVDQGVGGTHFTEIDSTTFSYDDRTLEAGEELCVAYIEA